MKKLQIGVWGLGRIGSLHALNVARSAGRAELVAVADPIKKLAERVSRKLTVRAYDTPAHMLKKERLDGDVNATPV